MISQMFDGCTHIPGEGQPEYEGLPVRAQAIDFGPPLGRVITMTSAWKPSEEELAMLIAGGLVTLTVICRQHPPVLLGVEPKGGI